ncbi:hypothetical protein BH09MYX1_BH09MYX1_36480 [soil metagenome]
MSTLPQNRMRPVHPGEILLEEFLKPLSLSANALATALDVPTNRMTQILRKRRGVSGDTAHRLARYFGTTPEFWMNLQRDYELRTEALPASRARRIRPRPASVVQAPTRAEPRVDALSQVILSVYDEAG